MSMKTYIATSLGNAEQAKALADALRSSGILVTYPWWTHGHVWDAKEGQGDSIEHSQWRCADAAISERDGVRNADFVIVILCDDRVVDDDGWARKLQGRAQRGTHTELGMAIALNKPVLLFASSAQRFETKDTCAFYFAPGVARVVLDPRQDPVYLMTSHAITAAHEVQDKLISQDAASRLDRCDWCDGTGKYQPARSLKAAPVDDAGLRGLAAREDAGRAVPVNGLTLGVLDKLAKAAPRDGVELSQEDDLGFDAPPTRYSQNPDGKETIDRMFDIVEQVYYESIGIHEKGQPFEPSDDDDGVRSALCTALCAALALKYEDRAGKKGDPEGDMKKAAFYRQMQRRWEQNDPSLDPRVYRAK